LTSNAAAPYQAGDHADSEEDLADAATPRLYQRDQWEDRVGSARRQVQVASEADLVVDSVAVAVGSEEDLEEIGAGSAVDLAETEVGMEVEAEAASDTSRTALERLPRAHLLDRAADEAADSALPDTVVVPMAVVLAVLLMLRTAADTVTGADALTTTEARTVEEVTVGQAAAIANLFEAAAATEIETAKVGMATARITHESAISTATTTKTPEANGDIKVFASHWVCCKGYSRTFTFQYSPSLPSSRVSGSHCSQEEPCQRLDCRLLTTSGSSASRCKHAAYLLAQLPGRVIIGVKVRDNAASFKYGTFATLSNHLGEQLGLVIDCYSAVSYYCVSSFFFFHGWRICIKIGFLDQDCSNLLSGEYVKLHYVSCLSLIAR